MNTHTKKRERKVIHFEEEKNSRCLGRLTFLVGGEVGGKSGIILPDF